MIRRLLLLLALLCATPAFAGAWDPMGPTGGAPSPVGPQGDPGCSVLPTSGAPSPALGQLCDWAFDASQGAVYGPKSTSGWGTPVIMTPVQVAQTAAAQAQQAASVAQAAAASAAASAASIGNSAANAAASAAAALASANSAAASASSAASAASTAIANLLAGANIFVAPQAIIASATPGAIIAPGAMLTVQNDPAVSNTMLYNPGTPPGWFTFDLAKLTLHVPSGSLMTNADALGIFLLNDAAVVSGSTCPGGDVGVSCSNAVATYWMAIGDVDGSATWALNPTISDCLAGGCVITTDVIGRTLVIDEADVSVHANKTTFQGYAIMGSSTQQPVGADGYTCGNLGAPGIVFSHCFVVDDATSVIGLYLGSQARTANSPSSVLDLVYYNAAGVGQAISIQSINSAINITSSEYVGGEAPNGMALAVAPHQAYVLATGAGDANLVLGALGAGMIIVNNSILPSVSGAESLGDSAYVFGALYTRAVVFDSTAAQISGAGDPSGIVQPAGTIYQRAGAAAGSRLCVSAGGGVWNCISGV
ncbi:hypothetical protein [Methylocystis heyeri]|uniref:Uncharacterized protein n=1 Tax=Methylocystis heyeri TaxID=391905 RepID=A0A6B8KIM5_9HYPH|nr:hypothetical protein [Methylocystis heyeri]QGM46745.1 hypothetical protein H2LOC_014160 [Methylocystis heyeri]